MSYWVLLKVPDLSNCYHPNEFAADRLLLIGNAHPFSATLKLLVSTQGAKETRALSPE